MTLLTNAQIVVMTWIQVINYLYRQTRQDRRTMADRSEKCGQVVFIHSFIHSFILYLFYYRLWLP